MFTKKIGTILIVLGAIVLILSLSIDLFGLGDKRIGASQLLGAQVGIFTAVFGYCLSRFHPDTKISINFNAALEKIYGLPASFWVILGFIAVYILLYITPVFFDPDRSMVYFNRYIPNKHPIGLDLSITMGSVEPWVTTGQSPYPALFYPPLTYILFAPMALMDYPFSYFLITLLTVLSYCILGYFAFLQIGRGRGYSLLMLVFLSGLISYGFQFELERGQFNVITFLLCMLSLYIFHRHYQFRYLAYLLFSISIHIKLYPAIFIFLFVKDWSDWKGNLKRFAGLGLFNFALLFALGYKNFVAFINAVLVQIQSPGWSWNGNHSIQAFVFNFLRDGYNLLPDETLTTLQENSGRISTILLTIILACILAVIVRAYQQNESGINPFVLLACTLGALIIPTSNDYTLPILVAPLSIFFGALPPVNEFRNRPLAVLTLLTISISYFSILYPFKYKPYFMNNSFPPLFIMLLAITFLYYLRNDFAQKPEPPQLSP